jgi:hypothetical protein
MQSTGGSFLASAKDNPLLALDLAHLCRFMMSLSGIIYHLSNALSLSPDQFIRSRRDADVDEKHCYATKAFAVFEEWPDRFYPFLEWIRAKSNVYGALSLLDEMGPLYVLLNGDFEDPWLTSVRSVAEAYIASNWCGPSLGSESGLANEPRMLGQRTGFPEDRAAIGGSVGRWNTSVL